MLANFYLIIFPREINGYQQIPAVSQLRPIQISHAYRPIKIPSRTLTNTPSRRIITTVRRKPIPNATTNQSFATSHKHGRRNKGEEKG